MLSVLAFTLSRGHLKEWRLEMKIHEGRKNTTIAQQMSKMMDLDSAV